MKTEKTKILPGKEFELNIKNSREPYEIIYANPSDEEIHLKILKSTRINVRMARWFLDYEYNQLLWSDGIFEILELDPRQNGANINTFLEVIHPEDRQIKRQAIEDLKISRKTIEINYRLLFSDKRIKWINEICNTDFDQNGHPVRSIGVINDITKHKLSEEVFKQKEEQLKNLVDSIPLGIATLVNNKFEYLNSTGVHYFGGQNSAQLMGKSYAKTVSPKSKKILQKNIEKIKHGQFVSPFEVKFKKLNGLEFDAELTLMKIQYESNDAIQFFINDISEQKRTALILQENQEKFKSVTTNISDVIWTIDTSGNFTYVSPSIKSLIGYWPEEIINKHFSIFLTPKSAKLTKNILKKSPERFKNLKSSMPGKITAESICKDGKLKWTEITANPMFNSKNEFYGYSGICRDITDRIKAEQLQKENETHLKELIETKDKFFSLIAHDLRTPFNSIIGFLDLILNNYNDINDLEKKDYLYLIQEDANKTLKLLNNLLEWAKAQTGNISINLRTLKLLQVLKNIGKNFESSLKLKKLQLQISVPENLQLYADENMLTTIFQNLISNSIKFSFEGQSIVISAIHKSNGIEICVADSGIGMHEEARKNLFDISKKITNPGTANEKGSGLGLILCKDFIERHHGTIEVKSEYGKGSQFIVFIPDEH
ncbi:MAG: PAS domain S-box protein [Prolixibacteraceae bacterium]